MIRNLPEGSRFNAAYLADHPPETDEQFETDPRREAIADGVAWTLDRKLKAMEINAINLNTAVTGNWKDKAPDFPTIGPAAWRANDPAQKPEPEFVDNFDFFRKMGWPGG
jgi:hypothetical protein